MQFMLRLLSNSISSQIEFRKIRIGSHVDAPARLCTQTELWQTGNCFVMLGGLNEEKTMKRAVGTTLIVLFCTCMLWGQGAMGNVKTVAGMGYDSKEKLYTYDEYNTMGVHQVSKGTVSGDTWTWTNDSDFGGKTIKGRFILKELSPKSYTFKYEISDDGNAWTDVMEGKSTKVEEKSAK
ncbi:MAG: hypothetical protein DMG60_22740 [Acidobacteria bacterium]|nr:MAG: hypothetical protein DMG60_22740 [Acidobacteriota bacterium]